MNKEEKKLPGNKENLEENKKVAPKEKPATGGSKLKFDSAKSGKEGNKKADEADPIEESLNQRIKAGGVT